MLVSLVIPAIQAKWPVGQWFDPQFTIVIHQDGAGAHCGECDSHLMPSIDDLVEAGNFPEAKITFYTQPSNSSDLNIFDLGCFIALQSAY